MCEDNHAGGNGLGNGLGRRALFVTGAAAALTLGSVSFASAADAGAGGQETRTVRGTLPPGAPDFVYVPVEVPAGVREIRIRFIGEFVWNPARRSTPGAITPITSSASPNSRALTM